MKLKGAIFDLDGTLLDSMYIWRNVGEVYLKSVGIEPHPGLREALRALDLRQSAAYFIAEYGVTDTPNIIIDKIQRSIVDFYLYDAVPKPRVIDFLDFLRGRNVQMCIATATPRHIIEPPLKKFGMYDYFSAIFTCPEVNAGKDVPVIYERSLEHLGCAKEDTLVFEDALYALRTAKADGFSVIGISDPSAAGQRTEMQREADLFVNDYAELIDAFTGGKFVI